MFGIYFFKNVSPIILCAPIALYNHVKEANK